MRPTFLVTLLFIATGMMGQADAQTGSTSDLPSPLEVSRRRQETQDAAQGGAENRRESNAELLFAELDNLIPGDFSENAPGKQAVNDAVSFFLAGRLTEVNQVFEDQAKLDPKFPPKELLFAGLWYAARDTKRGQAFLEQAAKLYPEYPGIYIAFSRLAINENRITDGLALLEKAERKMNSEGFSDVENKHFRSIYLDAMTEVATRQGRLEDARKFVLELQQLQPKSTKALLALAELEFLEDKVESSISYLEQLRKLEPRTRAPELVVASWYQRKADVDNARKFIESAAQKFPTDPIVQLEYANFALNNEEFQAARAAIEKLEAQGGEVPESLALKAKIAFATQAFGLAEIHYKKLTTELPNSFDAANMYALSLIENDDKDKQELAGQIARRNFQQLPNNPIAAAALGWIALKLGQVEQANQLLTRAAQSPRLAPEVAYYLATMLHQKSQSQQAKLILEPAIKSEGLFLYRGQAKKLMGEIEKGASELPAPKK